MNTPSRRVNERQFAQMWNAGVRVDEIARRFGVTRSAIKYNRKLLGLTPRPRGWKPKDYGRRHQTAQRQ